MKAFIEIKINEDQMMTFVLDREEKTVEIGTHGCYEHFLLPVLAKAFFLRVINLFPNDKF